jgi:hypothetical protein
VALLGKETGLILLAVGVFEAIHARKFKQAMPFLVLGVAYFAIRFILFGTQVSSYCESGFYLLHIPYENACDLGLPIQSLAYIENVVKNAVAPFAPVFSGEGGVGVRGLFIWSPLWVPSLLLPGLSVRRHLSSMQMRCLVIIIANAVLHYAVFRYRIHYLSWMAATLFFVRARPVRIAASLAVVLLAASIFLVNQQMDDSKLGRQRRLRQYVDHGTEFDINHSILRRAADRYL